MTESQYNTMIAYMFDPVYRDEPEELIQCDCCMGYFPEDDIVPDEINGRKTGWNWCEKCNNENKEQ